MHIARIAIEGYRSIRSITFPLDRLTVLVGENGVGKTNLYSALRLLQAAADGTVAEQIEAEGGIRSIAWAGERRRNDSARICFSVTLGASTEAEGFFALDPAYAFEIGYPPPVSAAFPHEAEVKLETLTAHAGSRKHDLMERRGHLLTVRDEQGHRAVLEEDLLSSETALNRLGLWASYPEIATMRNALADWRFYHGFRTDPGSRLRQPCPAITSPTLQSDGGNLAAVFATLRFIRGDTVDLDRAIEDAFPGASLVTELPDNEARIGLRYPEFPNRTFDARELSDGTLQYLALMGALMSYRLPPFLALNEPEASLHPSLLEPLARAIVDASARTQILVVTHSETLAAAIQRHSGISTRRVIKNDGATWIDGLSQIGIFQDN